jgi:hypothetical protein
MRIPKSYGSYRTDTCPYCGSPTYTKNTLGLPVCKVHAKTDEYPSLKCVCGDWIDLKVGKFGVYGHCMRCGNQNLNKILEFNASLPPEKSEDVPVARKKQKIDPTAYPLILD